MPAAHGETMIIVTGENSVPAGSVIIVPEIGQKHWEMALCGLSSHLVSVPWVELPGINVLRVDSGK